MLGGEQDRKRERERKRERAREREQERKRESKKERERAGLKVLFTERGQGRTGDGAR